MEKYRLFTIVPPDNVEIDIIKLRRRIFSTFGLVSAMAFPPIIPLLSLPEYVSSENARMFIHSGFKGFEIITSGIAHVSSCFFLAVTAERGLHEFIHNLKTDIKHQFKKKFDPGKETNRLIPAFQGFFLSHNESTCKPEILINTIEPPDPIHFSVFSLALIEVTVKSSQEQWWKHISWEIPLLYRSRKSGR
jgi:hypothetical protein